MTFGEALEALKSGKLVSRTYWHGEVVLFIISGVSIKCSEDSPLPYPVGTQLPHVDYIAVKAHDGVVHPFTPLHSDLLADDWSVVAS